MKKRVMDRVERLPYGVILALYASTVIAFAAIYVGLSYFSGLGPAPLGATFGNRVWNALYFSVVTSTNTGYGDITAFGVSRFFAAAETVLGLFLFAVFVTKLMSRRQELALREVHRISFENTFHNIREDLHIVRQDFDRMMREGIEHHALPDDEWDRLAVAYEQVTHLMHEIPSFYDSDHGLYTLDERRETLLIEAVHRTLTRLNQLLESFSKSGTHWIEREECIARLKEMIETINATVPLWQKRSPYEKHIEFERLLTLADALNARLAHALSV